jgi:hypothetical protein
MAKSAVSNFESGAFNHSATLPSPVVIELDGDYRINRIAPQADSILWANAGFSESSRQP